MSKLLSLSTLLTLAVLSFGAKIYSSESLQNSGTPLLKTLVQKSLEIEDSIDRGKLLWLIQSDGDGLNDEISSVTNLPEEEDDGDIEDILEPEEKSDPELALEEDVPTPQNDGALTYG